MKTNIYKIINLITNQVYVGKTIKSIEERFDEHKKTARTFDSNMYIHCAMRKYGFENFKIEIIDTVEDNWQYWEQYYIEKLNSHCSKGGYNITIGGDINPMDDEISRKHFYERVTSKEFREKQRIKSTGRHHSEESRRKMSLIQKEVQNRPEIKEKITLNQPNRCPVKMINPENGEVIRKFISCTDAMKYLGKPLKDAGSIKWACDKFTTYGRRVKMFGFNWSKDI